MKPSVNESPDAKREAPRELPSDHPAARYKLFVVEQSAGPDVRTICPQWVGPDELLTTWMSAGWPCVIGLEAAR